MINVRKEKGKGSTQNKKAFSPCLLCNDDVYFIISGLLPYNFDFEFVLNLLLLICYPLLLLCLESGHLRKCS